VVIVILQVKVTPQKRADAVSIIKSLIGPTEAKSDCHSCKLYSHIDNDDVLILIEQWQSQESLEDHICSGGFRKVLAVMDLASRQPEITFHKVSSTEGMELVERLLSEPETI